MEARIVSLPRMTLAGFVIKTRQGENVRTIPAFWGAYMSDGRMEKLHSEGFIKKHDEYGACIFSETKGDEFEYIIGVEIAGRESVPEGYDYREIPAAVYAVFDTEASDAAHFSDAIQKCWTYAYSEWFPKSSYKIAEGSPCFELYDDRSMGDQKVCSVYIPVIR